MDEATTRNTMHRKTHTTTAARRRWRADSRRRLALRRAGSRYEPAYVYARRMVTDPIREHGAQAVYNAACRAMEGDYSCLHALGIPASSLADAFDAQTAAYRAMTALERAGETAAVEIELARLRGSAT